MAGRIYLNVHFQRLFNESFPSGHVAATAATVTFINCVYRQRLWWLYLAIPFIGLTRIYVGAHFLMDCVAGAIVGVAVTCLVCLGLKALPFSIFSEREKKINP